METPPLPFSISTRDMNIFESRHINIFEHLETPYLLRKWLTSRTDKNVFWAANQKRLRFCTGRINFHVAAFFKSTRFSFFAPFQTQHLQIFTISSLSYKLVILFYFYPRGSHLVRKEEKEEKEKQNLAEQNCSV